jgi:transketolase
LDKIRAEFPNRFINVGIAEQNLINIATGLALEGYIVYAYAIAPFITMRCYEQIRVNLAILSQLRKMNINLIGVGAGFSYTLSGPTHHCLEDISIMRTLPNIEVISPSDFVLAQNIVKYSIENNNPKYIRFDAKPCKKIYENININNGFSVLNNGSNICVISTGFMTQQIYEIKDEIENCGIIDFFNYKKFDYQSLYNIIKTYKTIFVIEEGFKNKGGLDSLIYSFVNENNLDIKIKTFGIDDKYFFDVSSRDSLHSYSNMNIDLIKNEIKKILVD